MSKHYDRSYFERWYRGAESAMRRGALQRKVALALAVTEYHLGRAAASVLDVGCGEGAWRAPLRALRPGIAYLGLDSSDYAVAHWGRRRNLALVDFADLESLRPCAPVDLLVCADVMHYLPADTLKRGLRGLVALCDGVGFFEVYTREDAIDGDMQDFRQRHAGWYRRIFAEAGWRALGNHCYLSPARAADATALEAANAPIA